MDKKNVRRRDFSALDHAERGWSSGYACEARASPWSRAPRQLRGGGDRAQPHRSSCGAYCGPKPQGSSGRQLPRPPRRGTCPLQRPARRLQTTATISILTRGEADKKIYARAHARFKEEVPQRNIEDNFVPVTTVEFSNKVARTCWRPHADIIQFAIEGTRLVVKRD